MTDSSPQHSSKNGVFISYKRDDRFVAETLADRLRELGYVPWVDFGGIEGGDEWKRAIERGLQNSHFFLVLMTPESVRSTWVLYEVEQARRKNRIVIPIMLRTCTLPTLLADLQYVDFRSGSAQAFKALHRAMLAALMRDLRTEATTEIPVVKQTSAAPTQPLPSLDELNLESEIITPQALRLALVIEDGETTADILRDFFINEGFQVHIARTRAEAAEHIQRHTYAFVTLDMHLGADDEFDEQGRYLLDLLNRKQNNVPIVMITRLDYDKRATSDFFMTGRIQGMLEKPVDLKRLRSLVEQYTQESGSR